jgi:hypothetical protein
MARGKKVFRSRVSVLMLVLIFAPFVWIFNITHVPSVALIIVGVSLLPVFLILFGINYVIQGNKLYFRILGLTTGSVNIGDIVSIKRSYNPISSCAASLKRLEVTLRGRSKKYSGMLISPVKEQEFFDTLKAVKPHIRVNAPVKKGVWRIWDWDI